MVIASTVRYGQRHLNLQYLTKKQSVFRQIAAFVDKFKGMGGHI